MDAHAPSLFLCRAINTDRTHTQHNTANAQSMLSTEYTVAFWTMQKPPR